MTINILGLGESLKLYDGKGDLSFGVNDIMQYQKVDYVVCLDKQSAFTETRLNAIKSNTDYTGFMTQLPEWNFMPKVFKMQLQRGTERVMANLHTPEIPKSCFSPYVATALAYKMFKPDRIRVFGVDMTNHPNLHSQTVRIKRDWAALVRAIDAEGCSVEVLGSGILV
jgi:hypothetical protein